jgi:hypothetical protein
MKTNTFILIVSVYSLILGLPAIFAPAFSAAYFGGDPNNLYELSSMNFIGAYQIAIGFLGYIASRSSEQSFKRSWLLSIAFLTFFAIVTYIYNVNVRNMLPHKTLYFDCTIWLSMGLASLYFWNKEK